MKLARAIVAVSLVACAGTGGTGGPGASDTPGAGDSGTTAAADDGTAAVADIATDATSGGDVSGIDPADASPPAECVEQYSRTCDAKNRVIWLDSCGRPGWVFEICGADRDCRFGACRAICEPEHEKKCQGGSVFWVDSCGEVGGVAEVCPDGTFCQDAACVAVDLAGTWALSADPPKKEIPGYYLSVYPAGDIEIAVTDGQVTTTIGGAPFKGSLLPGGNKLTLKGTWHEDGAPPIEHAAVLSLELTAPGQLYGVEADDLSAKGIPIGKLTWNVSGAKQ